MDTPISLERAYAHYQRNCNHQGREALSYERWRAHFKPEERRVEIPASPGGGRKDDADKAPLDLLPWDALEPVARVLGFGAEKYGRSNWRGLEPHRVEGALLRHLAAHRRGEASDPDTGESHLAHLACNALFLLALEAR